MGASAGRSAYDAYHAPRYEFLLRVLEKQGVGASSAVLDVGPSRLTSLIRERLGARVDTLGFGEDRREAGHSHFGFDLNLAASREGWRRDIPAYDAVVMAEVFEHLHTAPELTLGFVRTLVGDGGLLVLQTPNAASLPKRVKLLLGRHPYEPLRADAMNPGHFREYTRKELRALAERLGFTIEAESTSFYFDARFPHDEAGRSTGARPVFGAVKNLVYRTLPPPLREGITMVWRRAG